MEEDPVMPTGQLEKAGQAVELLRRELRWTLVLALLLAGSKGGYERVSPCNRVTASFTNNGSPRRPWSSSPSCSEGRWCGRKAVAWLPELDGEPGNWVAFLHKCLEVT